jgi:hypothetical protein
MKGENEIAASLKWVPSLNQTPTLSTIHDPNKQKQSQSLINSLTTLFLYCVSSFHYFDPHTNENIPVGIALRCKTIFNGNQFYQD